MEWVREVRLAEEWREISKESGERLEAAASGENLAYVIYTSGSTGKPKGVLIEHRGVCNAIQASINTFGVHENSRVIQLASMSFDSSVLEIFSALASGATLYLVEREVVAAGIDLAEFLRDEAISVMVLPPSLEQLPPGDYPALETVIVGGEKCSAEMAARWCTGRRFFNVYAPTESTIYSTALEFSGPLDEPPGMGRPIANMQTYVLDRQMQPVPIGVAGEIYIGGVGLARGYFNLPGLTAEKFVPNPFSREPGSRLYRTGDLALQHVDGNLEFIGRLDSQVKVRGYRIELGDIEAALMMHPAVRYAIVIVREDEGGEKMLVAYLVGDREEVPTVTHLRGYLKEKLPEYMIPTAFIVLDALPLTTHNKIDYRALPAPDSSRPNLEEAFVAPRTPTEQVLVDIWSEILGTKEIGVHDNFFDLGGRSLTATQLMSRMSKALHVELALQNIFDAPTVATLAEVVERTRLETGNAPIPRAPREPLMPLSFAQQRIWFLHQMVPPEVYNGPIAAHVVGPLDIVALEASLNEIVRRHEVLRTSFVAEAGRPAQVIAPSLKLSVPLVDIRNQPEPVLEAEDLADEEAKRPFDLAVAPLLRAKILRLGDEEHVLLLTIHHIIFDGWSLGVFLRELDALYQAFTAKQPSPLPELPIQYADYAVWQRQWLQGELLEKQLSYWKTKLAELPELELPTDRPRSDVPTFRGELEPFLLPPALAERLKTLSRQEGATLFMTLLSGFKALLHRYTSQEDIVVSAPVANRNRTEIEGLIGFFVNSQVLRTDLSGNPTFRELVARVRQVTLEAHSHQDVPFELIVDELRPEGYSTSQNPLFRAAFSLQNTPAPIDYLPGLKVTPFKQSNHTSKFDLIVTLLDTEEGLPGMVQYNVDLFNHATVMGMMRNYETLLEEVSKNPDLCLLDVPLESGDATQHTSTHSLVNSRYQIESFDF
jgi:amino acid adenylation domain-containing protein